MQSTLRVLTVRQPWASAIFLRDGAKDVENRNWTHNYRGPLIIQSSARPEGHHTAVLSERGSRFRPLVDPDVLRTLSEDDFPCGVVVGVVELIRIDQDSNSNWASYDPDDYHWHLRNPQMLPDRISLKGRLGLWEPPDYVAEAIQRLRVGVLVG
jgi:hypothetical protein